MSDKSAIEWTDATWQIASGCRPVSPGCLNCYSASLAGTRMKSHPRCQGLTRQDASGRHVWTGEVRLHEDNLTQPLRWRRPRKIFVGDRTDLFHPKIPDSYIDRVFAVMALCPQHTFQVLTKRPERMRDFIQRMPVRGQEIARAAMGIGVWGDPDGVFDTVASGVQIPLPNVWIGVTVEDQARANVRIPLLLETPAAVRFLSVEPMLGQVDFLKFFVEETDRTYRLLSQWYGPNGFDETGSQPEITHKVIRPSPLHWVICGGESGPHARPLHPDWARSLRNQCALAGVPFMFKQWGEYFPSENVGYISAAWGTDTPNIAWPDSTVSWGNASGHGGNGTSLHHVGKRAAGRLLDGVLHGAMPEVRHG